MPEALFDAAVDLIHRFSADRGIYIISRYDTCLPFLAERYSRMPYPALAWFLTTQYEIDAASAALDRARPEYLFVDADIDRVYEFDLINPAAPLFADPVTDIVATCSVGRRKELAKVFDHVRADYHLVERAGLIAVWQRNGPGAAPEPGPALAP
jgi:hypothetical protein